MMTNEMTITEQLVTREPQKGEKKARVIYRCTRKDCRATRTFTTVQIVEKHYRGYGRYDYAMKYLVHRVITRAGVVDLTGVRFDYLPLRSCEKCGTSMKSGVVKGLKSDTPCDARCTSAEWVNCECSCGGENHGKDGEVLYEVG
jgi:hypothetical protein